MRGAEHPLGAREELRVVEVLEIVHGHGGRDVEPRERDRQRVVDGVELPKALAQAAGPGLRERHRDRALAQAVRLPVLGHLDLRQPLAGAGRGGGRERDLVQRPHLGQAAAEAARRRLGPADLAGHKREQADPDPHRRSLSRLPGTIARCPSRPVKIASLQGFRRTATPTSQRSSSS